MLSILITVITVVVNLIISSLTNYLIKSVKYPSITDEMGAVVKVVFIAQFFNTGIIILILNMNLKEHSPKEFWSLFSGRYTDYDPMWYKDVGDQIYQTYWLQMLMPYINFLIELLIN